MKLRSQVKQSFCDIVVCATDSDVFSEKVESVKRNCFNAVSEEKVSPLTSNQRVGEDSEHLTEVKPEVITISRFPWKLNCSASDVVFTVSSLLLLLHLNTFRKTKHCDSRCQEKR